MASTPIDGYLVLTPEQLCQAVREYVSFRKLAGGGIINAVDLSGDGKTTARVSFRIHFKSED